MQAVYTGSTSMPFRYSLPCTPDVDIIDPSLRHVAGDEVLFWALASTCIALIIRPHFVALPTCSGSRYRANLVRFFRG